MADNDKEVVSTNEYGISDEDYAKERAAARAIMKGNAPATAETAQEEKEDKTEPQQETTAAQTDETEDTTETVETQTQQETQEDPLADLPAEWKDKVASQLKALKDESEYQKKRYDSDIGRINAYQSKYEELRRTVQAKDAELAALKKAPPKPLKDFESPRIKEAMESGNADLVEMMEEARAALRAEFEDRFLTLQQRQEREQAEAYEQRQRDAQVDFKRKLDEKYENWIPVVYQTDDKGQLVIGEDKLPQFNMGWQEYLLDQPPALRNALETPQSADDAIWAIDNYNEWLKKKGYVKDETQTTTASIPNAEAIQKKRDADLKKRSPPQGHQVALQPTPTLDLTDEKTERKLRALARESIKKNDPSLFNTKNL